MYFNQRWFDLCIIEINKFYFIYERNKTPMSPELYQTQGSSIRISATHSSNVLKILHSILQMNLCESNHPSRQVHKNEGNLCEDCWVIQNMYEWVNNQRFRNGNFQDSWKPLLNIKRFKLHHIALCLSDKSKTGLLHNHFWHTNIILWKRMLCLRSFVSLARM